MKLYRTDHLAHVTNTLRNLADEAKAEESKIVGRHRKELTPTQKAARAAHRAGVHGMHTLQLMWIGLPAILAFEAVRPAWDRYVETTISHTMFGTSGHAEALSAISNHFLG